MIVDPRLPLALCWAVGTALLVAGGLRLRQRRHMRGRLRALATEWSDQSTTVEAPRITARGLAARLGARVGERLPNQVSAMAERVDQAGLTGGGTTQELLGWKVVSATVGAAVGLVGLVEFGPPGLIGLVIGITIGWFGIDALLASRHGQRRRAILHDLPTIMDLLVLSLEAGMGLDRAMRTVVREYHSALSDELKRVLNDVDLGLSRSEAFRRMSFRVGLDDLQSVSRAIVQSEELGTSLVGVMQGQSREVRMSRRRAAEAEALRTPIKMLIPLVVFILPTLFMLILGPVILRAGAAMAGAGAVP